jgi:hypothetical protein
VNIKLIALDMDGTVLIDDHRSITESTAKVIDQVVAEHILVVPTSGRIISAMPEAVMALPAVQFAITSNGALAYRLKDKKIMYSNCIPRENAAAVFRTIPKKLWAELWADGKIYVEREKLLHQSDFLLNPFHAEVVEKIGTEISSLSFGDALPGPIEKINLPNIPSTFKQKLWAEFSSWGIFSLVNTPNGFEIMNRGTSKAAGLLGFCRCLHSSGTKIQNQNIMAFGDSENDIEMLRASGFGIAMGNACERVKEAANAVTRRNTEDGVALAIETYILRPAAISTDCSEKLGHSPLDCP